MPRHQTVWISVMQRLFTSALWLTVPAHGCRWNACKVKCNTECTKQSVLVAGRDNKNNSMCSLPGHLGAVMQVTDSLRVRFCAASSTKFTSYLSIRDWTVTLFWGAAAMVSIRNNLRLCTLTLDCVLTLCFSSLILDVLSFLQVSFSGGSYPSLPVPLLAHS